MNRTLTPSPERPKSEQDYTEQAFVRISDVDCILNTPGLFKNDALHRLKVAKSKTTKIRRFGPTKFDQIRERLRSVSHELELFSKKTSTNETRRPCSSSEPIPTIERCPRANDLIPNVISV